MLTDMDFEFMNPDPHLFPNISSTIHVHSGFALEHKKTAGQILAEVKRLMAEHFSTDVILVSFVTPRDAIPTLSILCRSVTRSAERSRNLIRSS